jgi:hypothetical protein
VIALATCAQLPTGVEEDELAERLGARWAVWNDPSVDWGAFDLVVVRSVWDYTGGRDAFVAWARAVPRLVNPAAVLAWNTDKRYMADVAAAGLPVVATTFLAPGAPLPDALPAELVLKPAVSAGAHDTGRFRPAEDLLAARTLLERIHASGRTAMLQPFLRSVDVRGESALLYAGGEFSHAVNKGAILAPGAVATLAIDEDPPMAATVPTAEERAVADRAVAWVTERFGPLAYARVDLLAGEDGAPVILELELTEPSLFLVHAAGAAERFADAFRGFAV